MKKRPVSPPPLLSVSLSSLHSPFPFRETIILDHLIYCRLLCLRETASHFVSLLRDNLRLSLVVLRLRSGKRENLRKMYRWFERGDARLVGGSILRGEWERRLLDRTLMDVAGTSYESVLIFDAIVIYIWCLYENN